MDKTNVKVWSGTSTLALNCLTTTQIQLSGKALALHSRPKSNVVNIWFVSFQIAFEPAYGLLYSLPEVGLGVPSKKSFGFAGI